MVRSVFLPQTPLARETLALLAFRLYARMVEQYYLRPNEFLGLDKPP